MPDLIDLPNNLPIPEDDGGCSHLVGTQIPPIKLPATNGKLIDFSSSDQRAVIYIYPMTGQPNIDLPEGWDTIPGARGCTPQSCSFRDHYNELKELGAMVYGLSTQSSDYQKEAVNRLHLPFPLVSDFNLDFIHALRIPTFTVSNMVLSKRVTLIIKDRTIEKVFYPVFPPDKNADQVISYLQQTQA